MSLKDVTLFTGTVRDNLDPLHCCEDQEIWDMLELVDLKDSVIKLKGDLNYELAEGGENLR